MVQKVPGLARCNNRALHHFFVLEVTFLLALSSRCLAAFPRSDFPRVHSPPGRFVDGIPNEWRCGELKSGRLDTTGRFGRQIRGEEQVVDAWRAKPEEGENEEELTRTDAVQEYAVAKCREAEGGGERRGLESNRECIKFFRGQQCGSPGTRGMAFTVLRAARGAGVPPVVNPEAEVLLTWRASLIDGPKRVLANWNVSVQPNFCRWRGVACGNFPPLVQRVVSINLAGSKISGSISPVLVDLPFLTTLNLSYNRLSGEIPGELANMSSLQFVDLRFNQLNGSIPAFGNTSSRLQSLNLMKNKLSGNLPPSLGLCKQLVLINLAHNVLEGGIPPELGTLPNLKELVLSQNRMVGGLPASLGNCAALVNMSLGWNQFNGSIPDTYSNLQALEGLYLESNDLSGTLTTWLSDLPQLSDLLLYHNRFEGQIPLLLGNTQQLKSLLLFNNSFVGSIPAALVESQGLLEIDVSGNQLNGSIPDTLGFLTKLQRLHLQQNQLTGTIPTSLENCVRLTEMDLSHNQLTGSIPSLGTFLELQTLSLDNNMLNGAIPGSVTKCVNLTALDLASNALNGSIPGDIGLLKNLTSLDLSGNSLGGLVPALGGLSSLQSLNLADNSFSGFIPSDIGQLTNLRSLNLSGNSLGGPLPDLSNLHNLQYLDLENNMLSGTIPSALGNLLLLQVLSLGKNHFVGQIPSQLSQFFNLTILTLENNSLNGSIPESLGELQSLTILHLQGNGLSGPIPSSFNNFSLLQDLDISGNELTGEISATLLTALSQLQDNFSVADNRMIGPLPTELGLLTMVQNIDLSGNSFSDNIPDEIGNCTNLVRLNLAKNKLAGIIPTTIGKLSSLMVLNLSYNGLNGPIPAAPVGALKELVKLDLTSNNLSGEIPVSLTYLSNLAFLNVSYNNLQGPVPDTGTFQRFSASSFLGNPGLCGPILNRLCSGSAVPPSPANNSNKRNSLSTAVTVGIAAGVVGAVAVLAVAGFIVWRLAPFGRTPKTRGSIIQRSELFYPQLRFAPQDLKLATENFADVNILGTGCLSTVYRGVLPELVLVAVKKLKVPNGTLMSPEFLQELDEIGKLRHRHLVAILGYCFETEMNALVVQFMSNGSLEEHLHKGPACDLDWPTRAKVATGIAKGLTYLHHDCGSTVVHCDLKPSNVLLDHEFEAHLEDFGLSRLIFAHKLMDMTSSSVGSSIGYFPPEYAVSPTVSPKGDVYSFGMLLLELLTGKKPTLDMFKDDTSLTDWCQASFPNKIMDVLDPILVGSKETNQKQATLFMKVALMCTKEAPEDRPTIKMVVDLLR